VHGAHDDAELDAHEHLLVGGHARHGAVEVGGWNLEVMGLRSVAPAAGSMAAHAMPFIEHLTGGEFSGHILALKWRGGEQDV
jgi:hypothetical protein